MQGDKGGVGSISAASRSEPCTHWRTTPRSGSISARGESSPRVARARSRRVHLRARGEPLAFWRCLYSRGSISARGEPRPPCIASSRGVHLRARGGPRGGRGRAGRGGPSPRAEEPQAPKVTMRPKGPSPRTRRSPEGPPLVAHYWVHLRARGRSPCEEPGARVLSLARRRSLRRDRRACVVRVHLRARGGAVQSVCTGRVGPRHEDCRGAPIAHGGISAWREPTRRRTNTAHGVHLAHAEEPTAKICGSEPWGPSAHARSLVRQGPTCGTGSIRARGGAVGGDRRSSSVGVISAHARSPSRRRRWRRPGPFRARGGARPGYAVRGRG